MKLAHHPAQIYGWTLLLSVVIIHRAIRKEIQAKVSLQGAPLLQKPISKQRLSILPVLLITSLALISCGGGTGNQTPRSGVSNPLKILSRAMSGATLGQPYQTALAASGGTQPYWWTVAQGQLPPGLDLDGASGKITGIAAQTGEFSFTMEVKDSAFTQQQEASEHMTMTVVLAPLTITTPGLPGGTFGAPYSLHMQASGGIPPYIWSIASGALPPGLELNALTGEIAGTPQAEGTFSVVIQVTDSNSPQAVATMILRPPGRAPG